MEALLHFWIVIYKILHILYILKYGVRERELEQEKYKPKYFSFTFLAKLSTLLPFVFGSWPWGNPLTMGYYIDKK